NLGSPDSPEVPDVRRYLREFLMDGRVLDVSWPVRFAVVNFAILPTRPKESAKAYKTIWTEEGSPLITISKKVQAMLRQRVTLPVELAMRYQNPSIPAAVSRLKAQGVEEVMLIPLFPHYAMSSYESAMVRVQEEVKKQAPDMRVYVLPPFYEDPLFIDAVVATIQPYIKPDLDMLLFSFHGIPERHLRVSDPTKAHCLATPNCCETPSVAHKFCYRAQCFATVRAVVNKLNLPKEKHSVSFQSRLGKDPWLKPYTDLELERFPKEGVRKIAVICPAFVSDCLETIEEIGERGQHSFVEAGGEELKLIPCVNDHPLWIKALETYVKEFKWLAE
ncbi:MAG: ferrochelatase, partial [Verrucomicrobiales bacterium]